jgi:mono/diheme cytochrome c family protein
LVAYVRLLSKGYRLYDTYCAGCHGDDGHGVHPEDRLPPATVAPELGAEQIARLGSRERQGRVLHMVRRERGMMPHFRDSLTESQLQEIIEFLRVRGS